jgi:hypothetical protein
MISPTFDRGALYVGMAVLGPPTAFFTAASKDIIDGKAPVFHWVIWVLLALQTMSAALVALRAYIDGSNERSKNEAKDP